MCPCILYGECPWGSFFSPSSKQWFLPSCPHTILLFSLKQAFSNGLLQQATRVNTTAEVSPAYVQRVIQEAEQKVRT